jgi:alkylation response protein AidB-like acyl-CoA dehydrogenase
MDFALDDDQQLIVDTVRRFVDRELRAWAADADRAGAAPTRFAHAAGELGLLLDAVPGDAGGLLDGNYSHLSRALRGFELGRGCAALAALAESNVEPALAVAAWGSDGAKRALYASLAGGGCATFVHDSRGALTIDGDRISGKLPATPALAGASHVLIATADHVLLLATDDLKRDAFVPSGWRAARWATATCEARRLRDGEVLARGEAAREATARVLAWARVSLAARACGVASAAKEYAEAYGKERVQFGQPIGTFESLIRMRDDAQTQIRAAQLMVLNAAWQLDRGMPSAYDAASRARVLAGDTVARATIDGVQMYGGYGFVNDFPVEKLMRDARAFEALYGDERFGRVLAAKKAS